MISFVYSPPVHYSYQCGSSLISAFVPVFIYRALLSGPFEIIILYFLYYQRNKFFPKNSSELSWTARIGNYVPLLWKQLVFYDEGLN